MTRTMPMTIPVWARGACLYLAAACLVPGALCWAAPHLLFGPEGYRTVARGVIGGLGALLLGIGASLAWSAARSRVEAAVGVLRALVVALAGVPAVALYNMGALEPLRLATGVNLFAVIGGVLAFLLLPACLVLFALAEGVRRPAAPETAGDTLAREGATP